MRVFFIYLVLIFSISAKTGEREHLLVSIDSVFIESGKWHIGVELYIRKSFLGFFVNLGGEYLL